MHSKLLNRRLLTLTPQLSQCYKKLLLLESRVSIHSQVHQIQRLYLDKEDSLCKPKLVRQIGLSKSKPGRFLRMASSTTSPSLSTLDEQKADATVNPTAQGDNGDCVDSSSILNQSQNSYHSPKSVSVNNEGDMSVSTTSVVNEASTESCSIEDSVKRCVDDSEADINQVKKKAKLEAADPQENNADSTSDVTMVTETGDSSKVRRKKVAMLMVYSGTGYNGMQRNPPYPTIEEDLLTALRSIGMITEEHYATPQKMNFQRAARTDKGVSALGQVVSLQIIDCDGLIKKVNNLLPEQIRVLGLVRATRGFNSKNSCDSRTYSYVCPTFAFAQLEEKTTEDYRVSDKVMNEVNSILAMYKGTHNFHNFTSGRKPHDKSAVRYMMDLRCSPVYVKDGIEFTVIRVKGQSFMLHQIRKMIGLMIAVVRGLASRELINQAWQPEKCDIPIAPALGLMLEQLHYDYYNRRFGKDGIHDPIAWDQYTEDIEAFKHKFIYPNIVWKEKEEKSMMTWLNTLFNHTFDVNRDDRDRKSPLLMAVHNVNNLNKQDQNVEEEKASCEGAEVSLKAESKSETQPLNSENTNNTQPNTSVGSSG